ncbi:MAG: hypothetical protein ACREOU_05065 [Candidatus Eiseniibacteriota bacterium]
MSRRFAVSILPLAPLAILVPCAVPQAFAAATQYWTLRSAADYAQAELDGIALAPDGALEKGPSTARVSLPDAPIVWAIEVDGDRAFLGTGPGGRVLDVRGSRVESDSTGEGMVFALTKGPDGALFAGTGPEGRVVRLEGGKRTIYYDTGEKYVWALAWVGKTLYAATGPAGKLYAIEGEGRARVVFDARASHLTSLAADGKGGVFVGASGRGIVYHVADDRVRALYEAPEKEIRALTYDGRALYAAALSAPSLSFDGTSDQPEPATPEGQRSVVYRIVPDSSVSTFWVSPQGLIYAMARANDGLWIATGGRAALYKVDSRGRGTAVWNGGEGQATALARTTGEEVLLATSNPSRLYRVRPGSGRGTALSPVFDAKRLARWGRLWAADQNGARFKTRSGNTGEPDSTWSGWADLLSGDMVASPAARYLQWQLELGEGARARPSGVTVAWGEVNQPPRIEDFVVYPQPGKYYEGEINIRRDPVTQELPDGKKVQFSVDAPRKGSAEALPPWAQGIRAMSWKAQDPNGDDLSYRLYVRREGENAWTPVAVGLSNALYSWDTSPFPDGRYEVRLVASDEDANPPGEGLEDQAIAGSVDVDRTPPVLASFDFTLTGDVAVVRGEARDTGAFVAKVEVAIDESPWYASAPDDGLWDETTERFTLRLEGIPPGDHLLKARAIDSLGNFVSATRALRMGR